MPERFLEAMEQKIKSIDWSKVASDVAPFLGIRDKKTLMLWEADFFMDKLEKLKAVLKI